MQRATLQWFMRATLVLALAAATPAWSQAPQRPDHPKLALVLSGGGAMGIAHVGAIQELERLGIRPDLIVGTSMGAVVGGLYASGMNGAQLEEAVHQMNWDAIFNPSPPRDGLTYRQKQQQADFPVKASVGVNRKGLVAPDALVSDANLLLELRRLLRGRAAVPTFDDLSIPYRAVATDIETGQRVVLDRGELAGAMRASMSVPGVFAPYHLNGKLLVDGGMSDNVPIDVARELGADVVIVVATQTPMATGDKMRSVGDVLGQTVTMLILANERQQLATLKPTDVLARIDIAALGLGAADFKQGQLFIPAGRKAIQEQEAPLRRIAASRSPDTLIARASPPPPVIDYVKVENDSKLSDKTILRDVEPFVGKPLNTDAVVVALQGIYATGVFSRVDYRIEKDGERTGLVVDAQQKSGDANRLRLGLTLAATDEGRNEFDISAELRLLQLDRQGSEARFVAVVGDRKILSGEYFKVLDSRRRWFIAPMIELQSRPVPTYDSDGFRLNEYDVSYVLGTLAAGRQVRSYEVRVGIQRGFGNAELQEGIQTVPDTDLDLGRIFASVGVDTFDSPYFPTKGLKGQLYWTQGFKSLGDDANYQQVSGGVFWSVSSGRHNLILNAGGGDTYQGSAPLTSLYSLGGAFSFPGFNVDELTGSSYGVARLIYRYKLTGDSKSLLGVPFYAGASLVTGNTWAHSRDANFNDLRLGGNVYVAADTIIGPVYLAAGFADRGRSAIYLFIGRPF